VVVFRPDLHLAYYIHRRRIDAIFWQFNQNLEPELLLGVKFSDYASFIRYSIYSFCSAYERKIQ